MKDFKKLLQVSRPARYINGEINSIHKDHSGRTTFCLIFPDVYEVGISHIGYKMLYERLNLENSIVCERFFMPWPDAISAYGQEMFVSLESSTDLKEFDVLGFSFQYELAYSNMLKILIESGLEVRTVNRSATDPIVIAGGPCVCNPMPIADFVDVFFIGESEVTLPEAMNRVHEMKKEGRSKADILGWLNSLPYTYVPAIDDKKHVKRSIHTGFSEDYTIKDLIVPSIPAVQDRVAVEISRGCTRGCRFCQAGMIYRPNRERSVDNIACDAMYQLEKTGYLEASMLSLSASDYSRLEELLVTMVRLTQDKSVSLALPSIRADRIQEYIFRELSKVRKAGFTIAPEAGSQRMRDAINKGLTEEAILEAVHKASDAGWNGAKLYFMIGLPGETMEDVLEIAELSRKAKYLRKGRFSIKVSVSNFVPKAHTPYQWCGQNSGDEFYEKRKQLKELFIKYKIPHAFHGIKTSVLEGAMSRGSRELGDVIEEAVRKGAMFDAWTEHFNFSLWEQAFEKFGYKVSDFAEKTFGMDDTLPWEHIDSGVDINYLKKEYEKSTRFEFTPDCTEGDCTGCGVCDFKEIKNTFSAKSEMALPEVEENKPEAEYHRYAAVFSKMNRLSLLSAIETQRFFMHVLTIADTGLKFTYGFNPQPKLSYVQAASTGLQGENEVLVFECAEIKDTEAMKDKLNGILPQEVRIKHIATLETNPKHFDVYVRLGLSDELHKIFREKYDKNEAKYEKLNKKGLTKVMDAKDFTAHIGSGDIVFKTETTGNFNCFEFFESLGYERWQIDIIRKNVYLVPKEEA
ncbi:MAG: TIGR03960 family B12-binding radical SAM protein [Deferribacterales bacterium]